MPKTPSRLVPPQFGGRVVMGSLAGAAIGLSHGSFMHGALGGVICSVAGTLAGGRGRAYAAKLFGRDLPAALLEDVIAIGLALVALRTLGQAVFKNG